MRKIDLRTGLFISVIVIVLTWVFKIHRNIGNPGQVVESFQALSTVFLQAFGAGLITFILVLALLRLTRERFVDIGFTSTQVGRQIGIGCFFGLLIFILDKFAISPLLDQILPKSVSQGIDMKILFNDSLYIPIFVLIALFKGGFSEELWRVFVLTRFEKALGKAGLYVSLVVGSIVFGIGHLYQGVGGMISITLIGFFYALVYLRRRLAWEAVAAHASFNLISIILGYLVYSGK